MPGVTHAACFMHFLGSGRVYIQPARIKEIGWECGYLSCGTVRDIGFLSLLATKLSN
ncbi:hypothetical protein FHY12_000778 [Xanthomonas arboricola]|nr:hypothetical protein [Xanthomonas euroxanthea]